MPSILDAAPILWAHPFPFWIPPFVVGACHRCCARSNYLHASNSQLHASDYLRDRAYRTPLVEPPSFSILPSLSNRLSKR